MINYNHFDQECTWYGYFFPFSIAVCTLHIQQIGETDRKRLNFHINFGIFGRKWGWHVGLTTKYLPLMDVHGEEIYLLPCIIYQGGQHNARLLLLFWRYFKEIELWETED